MLKNIRSSWKTILICWRHLLTPRFKTTGNHVGGSLSTTAGRSRLCSVLHQRHQYKIRDHVIPIKKTRQILPGFLLPEISLSHLLKIQPLNHNAKTLGTLRRLGSVLVLVPALEALVLGKRFHSYILTVEIAPVSGCIWPYLAVSGCIWTPCKACSALAASRLP